MEFTFMKHEELSLLPVAQLARLLRSRRVSPVELVTAYLERIVAVEGSVNAYITVMRDEAMAAALEAKRAIGRGEYRGPLHGMPVALKDLFNTKGVRTTSGTKVMSDFIPAEDCTVAVKLKGAGAILLGKLNMTELAYGATGENIHYGDTRNPWNSDCISGGSSSGSAAATAAGECAAALGSDTGGSVRIPASLCGVVGLKPTYGRVSLNGVTPLCWSMDHVGILTRTVEDCAIVLNFISGYDPRDPSSVETPVPNFTTGLKRGNKSLRIGLPLEHAWNVLSDTVRSVVGRATEVLAELGASVTDVSLPSFSSSQDVSSRIMAAEALVSNGELLRSHWSSLDPKIKQRLEMGLNATADDYIRAQQARARMTRETLEVMRQVDILALPTTPIVAPPRGVEEIDVEGTRLRVLTGLTLLTRFANLTGMPAINVPCGFSEEGLPVGLQLIGRPFEEATVLRAAYAYEQTTEWHKRHPVL